MTKFKVGDYVKVVTVDKLASNYVIEQFSFLGEVFKVVWAMDIDSGYSGYRLNEQAYYQLDVSRFKNWCFPETIYFVESCLELANPVQDIKKDHNICPRYGTGLVEKTSQSIFGNEFKVYSCQNCFYCEE